MHVAPWLRRSSSRRQLSMSRLQAYEKKVYSPISFIARHETSHCFFRSLYAEFADGVLIISQCTNCASACKRCDEARPCERCVKYGLAETCIDGVRKERKKGIKRGPYKRKNRAGSGEGLCIAE